MGIPFLRRSKAMLRVEGVQHCGSEATPKTQLDTSLNQLTRQE